MSSPATAAATVAAISEGMNSKQPVPAMRDGWRTVTTRFIRMGIASNNEKIVNAHLWICRG
jgi:hypothetical protein